MSSSDEDCNIYSNFKKFRQKVKKSVVVEKPKIVKTVAKKTPKKKEHDSSSDSEEDFATAYKRHIAEKTEREKKAAKKPRKADNIWDEYDKEHGTVNGERVKPKRSKEEPIQPSPSVQQMLLDMQQDEMREQYERAQFEAQLRKSERQAELQVLEDEPKYIFVTMSVMNNPDFNEVTKLDYDSQLAELLLKYAPMAGFNPNDVHLVWDKPDGDVVVCKFWDTPKSLNMEVYKYAKLMMAGKNGVKAEVRKKGDIKLKINLASQRKPLEKIIQKDSTFGELKKELEKELNVPPSKMKIIFDAETVSDSATPEELDMEEADVIDLALL